MPLSKPYPPTEIDYKDWNDLADNYAGKAVTKIVNINGKGDYSTIQTIKALPTTHAGEILVKGGEYVLSKATLVKDREDLVICARVVYVLFEKYFLFSLVVFDAINIYSSCF